MTDVQRQRLHCNFCKLDSIKTVVLGRAVGRCPWCGSNNLTDADGNFVGPPQETP